jgi:hypothetical protein
MSNNNKLVFLKKNNPQIKEASILVGKGLLLQEEKNFDKSKNYIQSGIDKLKNVIVEGAGVDIEKVINYYSLFEKFLSNVSTQQENDKAENDISQTISAIDPTYKKNIDNKNLKDIISIYLSTSSNYSDPEKIFEFTSKLFKMLENILDMGFYISNNIFIRKEIFLQENAKIEFIHQKNETHKVIIEKIENLNILIKSNVIQYSNLEKFCDLLNDIQNKLTNEMNNIPPSKYKIINQQVNNTYSLIKKFSEISNKLKSNLLDTKIKSNPDYFTNLQKLIRHFKDFENILNIKYYKPIYNKDVIKKKKEICDFFYHTILKWTLNDLKNLTLRFLQKKIMLFENFNLE